MGTRKLNIKNLVPRKDSQYRQGYYQLLNPSKYIGDPSKIIYRSSYEARFARYCDSDDRIIKWSSEPLVIPYYHPVDRSIKSYNVDFYVKLRTGENTYKEYLIEVKPARQLKKPQMPTKRVTEKAMTSYNNALKTYMINISKFNAAKEFAESRNMSFLIVTEAFIF